MSGKRIGVKDVRALGPGETVWDSAVPSFGARRQKGAAVAYVLKFRTAEGRQRWHTIGRHGAPWTPDTAREEAKRLLGEVASGGDPSGEKIAKRRALTVAELCDRYFEDALAGKVRTRTKAAKKPGTLTIDRGRIERHIKPLLGAVSVAAVTRHDIEKFLHDIADGRTAGKTKTKTRGLARVTGGEATATRTVGLLGAIFTYAVRKDMRPENPVRGVALFADRKRERRLSDEEYAQFGEALRKAEGTLWPPAVAAARFIALTGFRRSEAVSLRWFEVDLARCTATLADTKTGKSMRPLSRAACDALRARERGPLEFVFPASRGDGPMTGFPQYWARIAKLGALPADVTPHVLRHSFASLASDLGYSEPTIATLVGHAGRSITSRYVHSADAVLLAAADAVAGRTAELMGDVRAAGIVVELAKRAS